MSAAPGPSTRTIARVFFTVVGLAAALYMLYLVREVVGLVAIAVFLAIALGPPVDFFHRRRLGRGASILLVYGLLLLSVVGVGLLVVPPIVTQVNDFARELPEYIEEAQRNDTLRRYDERYDIVDKLQEQAERLPARLGDAASTLQAVTVGVFSALVQLITVLTLTFFLLLDGGRIFGWLAARFRTRTEGRVRRLSRDVYGAVSGYVAGALTIALINALISYTTLTILGVPFAVPLAVVMFFLGLIPLVGATIGGIFVAIITLFNDFPTDTIVWVVVLILYQQLENNVLQPVVYRRTVNVHPLFVIVAILMGSTLLGVLGALVAIPIAATLQIVARDVWEARQAAPPTDLLVVEEEESRAAQPTPTPGT